MCDWPKNRKWTQAPRGWVFICEGHLITGSPVPFISSPSPPFYLSISHPQSLTGHPLLSPSLSSSYSFFFFLSGVPKCVFIFSASPPPPPLSGVDLSSSPSPFTLLSEPVLLLRSSIFSDSKFLDPESSHSLKMSSSHNCFQHTHCTRNNPNIFPFDRVTLASCPTDY